MNNDNMITKISSIIEINMNIEIMKIFRILILILILNFRNIFRINIINIDMN